MSLEAALAETTAALNAHAAILQKVSDNQERLLAGQAAAIERIDSGKAPKPAKTAPKETPAPTPDPEPEAASTTTSVTDDEIKAAATAWMDGKSKEERTAVVVEKLNPMLEHFGLAGGKLTGPESKLSADQRKQALFYINRWAGGVSVDFNADYDFDGPVDQGAEVDPFG